MKQEYFDKHYGNGALLACYPIHLRKIGFVHQDYVRDDTDNRQPGEFPTRFIVYFPDTNEAGTFGTVTWGRGVDKIFPCANQLDWIVGTNTFSIDEISKKTDWYPMPQNERGHLGKGFVNINGRAYAYGMVRSVFKYLDTKQWENITPESTHPKLFADVQPDTERFVGDRVGFSALDGFNENDIYAGGNQGDCWHYDGTHWSRVDVPFNGDISAITCAPNDLTYIACRLGPVAVGRGDSWTIIDGFKQVTHSAWFSGRMYFASENGRIYTYNDGGSELAEAVFNPELPQHMRHLISGIASCEECLVAYTKVQAYAYDGQTWYEIIEIPSLSSNQ